MENLITKDQNCKLINWIWSYIQPSKANSMLRWNCWQIEKSTEGKKDKSEKKLN